jgi:hypothetical protein
MVAAVFETTPGGTPVRAPDRDAARTPARPDQGVVFNLPRPRGYEGVAASQDHWSVDGLPQARMWDAGPKDLEKLDAKVFLRIFWRTAR